MTKREIESGRVDIRLLRVGSPRHAPTYPALYKTSTEKHDKNINGEIFEIVNRQTRYHVRFWFSLYFWPKPCQYRLYLISRFPELFICESLQSWPTDQRGPSFSYISFTFTKTKFFWLVLYFTNLLRDWKNTPILPIYWCYQYDHLELE